MRESAQRVHEDTRLVKTQRSGEERTKKRRQAPSHGIWKVKEGSTAVLIPYPDESRQNLTFRTKGKPGHPQSSRGITRQMLSTSPGQGFLKILLTPHN